MILIIFFRISNGNDAVRDRTGCLIFVMNLMFSMNFNTPLVSFTHEKVHFYKEQDNNMYRITTYFLSKASAEIVIQFLLSIIVWGFVYFPCGLNTYSYENSLWFTLTVFLFGYSCVAMAYLFSVLIDRMELVPTMFPLLIFSQMMTSGYFVNIKNIPYWFYPFKYISLFRYSYQALAYNEFDHNTDLDCNDPKVCIIPTVDFEESKELSVLLLFLIAIANNIATCVVLKVKAYLNSRRK